MFGFFQSHRFVIEFSQSTLRLWKIIKEVKSLEHELNISPEKIIDAFGQIKKVVGSNEVFALLPGDLVFILDLELDKDVIKNNDLLRAELETHAPESLLDADWDILKQHSAESSVDPALQFIQVSIPVPSYWTGMKKQIQQHKINLAKRVPISVAEEINSDPILGAVGIPNLPKKESTQTSASKSAKDTLPKPTAPASTKHLKNTALKTEAVSEESVKHQEEEKPLRIDPIETIIKEEHEHPTHREKKKIVDNSGGKNAPIKTPTNPLVLGFITIISALIMIAFGYILSEYQLFNSVGTFLAQDQQTEVVDETPDPTPEPTPAPTPEPIDFSIYTVRVLNGTGTAGEAGRAATQLESLGFEEITTGNAPSFSITQTTVRVKADVSPEVVQSILTELNNYSATTSAELQDSDAMDILITLGSGTN